MKSTYIKIIFAIFFVISITTKAQPFTKKYIMAYHTCDANCNGFSDHITHLVESDDGENWSLVPNFEPYQTSVPDVIIRGEKLYIFSPRGVKRYDRLTDTWDSDQTFVEIFDKNNQPVQYVDPSAIIDDQGRIVLFFLNSTGSTGDPAGCPTLPCTKYFDSAVEIDGSDGTMFRLQDGHRAEIQLEQSPASASDPDIFYDGSQYILYISQGANTLAYHGDSLHGSYVPISSINGVLTHEGGVPCGYYDPDTQQYWTYVHGNDAGSTVIKRAVHSDFSMQPNNFTTVINYSLIGDPMTTTSESPSICVNTFLTTSNDDVDLKPKEFYLKQNYPNPFNPSTNIEFSLIEASNVTLDVSNVLGETVEIILDDKRMSAGKHIVKFNGNNLSSGIYFYRLVSGNGTIVRKMILSK